MKTKSIRRDKVNIITLGCSKNMVDSEVLSGQLRPMVLMWPMKVRKTGFQYCCSEYLRFY